MVAWLAAVAVIGREPQNTPRAWRRASPGAGVRKFPAEWLPGPGGCLREGADGRRGRGREVWMGSSAVLGAGS